MPIITLTCSPNTSNYKLPVASAKVTFIMIIGKGSTIFLHFRHWNKVYYCWIVERLQTGHALYYFFSFI